MSLAQSMITTMLPITDVERAREFYSNRLELPFDGTNDEGSLIYRLNGAGLMLLHRPGERPVESTTLSFEVDNLDGEMADLRARGVVFEDYDMPGLKTQSGIAEMGKERASWFKDPDGNVLCLHSQIS